MRYVLVALFFMVPLQGKTLDLSINAEEAVLMNAKTGKVLYEKNGHQQAYPASTTKISTALVVLNKYRNDLDKVIAAERESVASITPQAKRQSNYRSPPHWLETDGTHVGIKRGEEFRLHELLHLMMIASANDAANVIAQGLGGTIPKFMEEANTYLKTIGCKDTHFNNPHGLHHPEHFTTAYDLALMAREGLKDPLFRKIVSSVRYTCPQTNLELERNIIQGNHLLRKGAHYYAKAIGVKTGFTQTAGKNLVAAAQDGDRVLIAVALGYKGPRAELYQDVIKMFEAGFSEPKMRRTLLAKGEQQKLTSSVAGASKRLRTYLAENLTYDFYVSEETPVKIAVVWEIPPLPIAQGTAVGKIKVIDAQGNALSQAPLFALEEIKPTTRHQFSHFLAENHRGRKIAFVAGLGVILLFLWRIRKRKTSRRSRSI